MPILVPDGRGTQGSSYRGLGHLPKHGLAAVAFHCPPGFQAPPPPTSHQVSSDWRPRTWGPRFSSVGQGWESAVEEGEWVGMSPLLSVAAGGGGRGVPGHSCVSKEGDRQWGRLLGRRVEELVQEWGRP